MLQVLIQPAQTGFNKYVMTIRFLLCVLKQLINISLEILKNSGFGVKIISSFYHQRQPVPKWNKLIKQDLLSCYRINFSVCLRILNSEFVFF